MHTAQLIAAGMAAAALAAGCNRAATDENARRAAAEVRDVASRAGDQLADRWLTTKIQAQYFADEDIKARYINVSSDDGVVTIAGHVDTSSARDEALQIARNTDGVREVRDQLAVGGAASAPEQADASLTPAPIQPPVSDQPAATSGTAASPLPPRPRDADVTTTIQARFFLDNTLKTRTIQVDTRQGVVTLRGDLTSDHERAQALLIARTTAGVDRVEDALTVTLPAASIPNAPSGAPVAAAPAGVAPAADTALTERVRSTLAGDPQAKTGSIDVSARDGIVLLDGTMPSAAARQRVVTLARQTEGVVQVIDRITVRR